LLESLKESLKTAEDKAKGEEERIKGIIEEIDRKLQETAQKLQAAKNAEGKYDTSVTALDALNAQITQNNDYQTNLNKDAKNKTPQIKTKLEELKTKTTEAKNAYDNLVAKNNQLKTQVEAKYTDAQSSWSTARTGLDAALTNKNETKLKEIKTALEASLELAKAAKQLAADKDYGAVRINSDDLINNIERDLTKIKDALEGVERDRIAKVKEKLETVIKSLDDLIKKNDHANKYDSTRAYVTQLNNLINTIENDVYDIYNKPENTSVPELNQKLTELKNKLDEAKRHSEAQTKAADDIKKAHDDAYQNWKNNEYKQAKDADNANPQTEVKINNAIGKFNTAKTKLETLMARALAQEYNDNKADQQQKLDEINTKIQQLEDKIKETVWKQKAQEHAQKIQEIYNRLEMLTNFKKINEDIAALEPLISAAQDFINNEVKDSNAAFLTNLKNTIQLAQTLIQQKRDYIAQETTKHKTEYENIKNQLEHLINLFNSIGTKSIELTNAEFWRANENILSNENLGKLNNTGDKFAELAKKTKELGDDKYEKLALEELEPLISKARTLWWLKKAQGLEFSLSHAHQLPSSVVTANITSIGHEHDRYDFVVEKMTYNDLKGYVNIRVKYWFKIYGDTLTETRDYRIKTTIKYEAFEFKNLQLKENVYDYEAMKRNLQYDNSYEIFKKYFAWENNKLSYELILIENIYEDKLKFIVKAQVPNSEHPDAQTDKSNTEYVVVNFPIKAKIIENRNKWIEDNKSAIANSWELKRTDLITSLITVNDVKFKPDALNLIPNLEIIPAFISPNDHEGTLKIHFNIHDKISNSNIEWYSKTFSGLKKYEPTFNFQFSDYFMNLINKWRDFGRALRNLTHTGANLKIDNNLFTTHYKLIWNTDSSSTDPKTKDLKDVSIRFSDDRHGLIFNYKIKYSFVLGRTAPGQDIIDFREVEVKDKYIDYSLVAKLTFFIRMITDDLNRESVNGYHLFDKDLKHYREGGDLGLIRFKYSKIYQFDGPYRLFWRNWPRIKKDSQVVKIANKYKDNNDGFFQSFQDNLVLQKDLLQNWLQIANNVNILLKYIELKTPDEYKDNFNSECEEWKFTGYVTKREGNPDRLFKESVIFIGDNEDQSNIRNYIQREFDILEKKLKESNKP
ncbi:hypothetical protein OF364_00630, partial [Mycoplasma enhydrae]|uniref:hypothetical protein n=1 Tax=Mycoplasma enhydrae TaxID=2499220 RepID=UPI0021E94A9E